MNKMSKIPPETTQKLRAFLSLKNVVREIAEEETEKCKDIHPILDHYNSETNEKIGRQIFKE